VGIALQYPEDQIFEQTIFREVAFGPRNLVPIFVPIFVSAFRRANELATAMDARGFRCSPQRTRLQQLHFTLRDLVASLIVLGVILAAIGSERLN
jgi:energy-coupling factor transport system permease protein